MSVAIGCAAGGGPFLLGALADATSTHTAFLVVPGLMVAALVLLLVTPRPAPAGPSPAVQRLPREPAKPPPGPR
jgi:predicted MFS family arabinose efflux permease